MKKALGWWLVVVSTSLPAAPAKLTKVLWTCSVPCESDKGLHVTQFAWCGAVTLSPAMLEGVSPLCRRQTGDSGMKAVRFSDRLFVPAHCETSSNPCATEGLANVGWTCAVECKGHPLPLRYATCAIDSQSAWSAATQVCRSPVPPSVMRGKDVCTPHGQTACE